MNRADLVRAVVACETAAKEFRAALSSDAQAEWEDQQTAPTWRTPAATVTGSVTHAAVTVVDEAKFLAWVRERYPTEVETIVRPRPAWQSPFLDSLISRGNPPCDDGGEVIPGLAFTPGGEFKALSIRPLPQFVRELRAAAQDMVAGRRPLELPTGEVTE